MFMTNTSPASKVPTKLVKNWFRLVIGIALVAAGAALNFNPGLQAAFQNTLQMGAYIGPFAFLGAAIGVSQIIGSMTSLKQLGEPG